MIPKSSPRTKCRRRSPDGSAFACSPLTTGRAPRRRWRRIEWIRPNVKGRPNCVIRDGSAVGSCDCEAYFGWGGRRITRFCGSVGRGGGDWSFIFIIRGNKDKPHFIISFPFCAAGFALAFYVVCLCFDFPFYLTEFPQFLFIYPTFSSFSPIHSRFIVASHL